MDLRTRIRNQNYWDHVFSPANEPKKEIKPGSRYVTLPGWHPTPKCVRGSVRTREPLMADAMIHVDTNPFNTAVAEFPVVVRYRSLQGKWLEHVPDLAVRRLDGSVAVVDVMPVHVQRHLRWPEHRTQALRQVFAELGAHYRLLDERTLHLMPLMANLRCMWRHKRIASQPAWIAEVASEVLRLPLPSSIASAMRGVVRNAMFTKVGEEEEWTEIGEVNPVFTACMQLAMDGKIGIDLQRPFSQTTRLCTPPSLFLFPATTELRFEAAA